MVDRERAETSVSALSFCEALRRRGYCVLRGCFDPEKVLRLRRRVDGLYERLGRHHIEPRDLDALGELPFHETLLEPWHRLLLDVYLGLDWMVSESTATRRIGPDDLTHMRPLKPHIDAFFHLMVPTVNFWTPLQPCGDGNTPGLAVWELSPSKMASKTGFDAVGRDEKTDWNFRHFDPRWFTLSRGDDSPWFATEFGPGNEPRLDVGDAIALTNWTLHATGSGDPAARRSNVELRFRAVVPSRVSA